MATSKLQQQVSILLSTHLGQYTIRENHRPDWLDGLELDFYIEELQVGIEVQGIQHFEFSPMFHKDISDFHAQIERDRRKIELCTELDIGLYYIRYPSRLTELLDCLNRVSAVYQEQNAKSSKSIEYTLDSRNFPSYYKLYSKVGYAYKSQNLDRARILLAQLNFLVEHNRLVIPDQHFRKLLQIKVSISS